ncbi:MAG: acetate--CoA ligase family protein [Alphaproteobacteria bacterium]|nr:acetate--CoA ligase family protein [Alphaproteobacteria bacterium]
MAKTSDVYKSLEPLFCPKTIAVLGASAEPSKIGGRPVQLLKDFGYTGKIFPVNPNYEEVQGLKAYASIKDIKEPIDQVILAVPARFAVQVAEDCASVGVKSMVAFTSGFAEMNAEGEKAQLRLAEIAKESGMRILGPNCLGVFNSHMNAYSTFTSSILDGRPKPGPVGIASQSGAFGSHCFVLARARGLGMSYWATTGNECDVGFAECVQFLAEDEGTKVILGYMEGCRDPERLYEALALAHSKHKPVIIMKVGGSEVGAAAAASHTASLAGSDDAFDSVFDKFGVYRAKTLREAIDISYACSFGVYPKTNRLGIVTISGGAGVVMADAAEEFGLDLAPMPDDVQKELKELVPFAGTRNPVDTTANFFNDWTVLTKFFEAMLEKGNYDAIGSFFTYFAQSDTLSDKLMEAIRPIRKKYPDKLMALSIYGNRNNIAKLENEGILAFEDPREVIQAIAALYKFRKGFNTRLHAQPKIPETTPKVPKKALNEYDAKRLLRKAGIPSGQESLAKTPADAAKMAARLGFPVVLKIVSVDIQHKTEIGGVVLNLKSQTAVRSAFNDIMANAKKSAPDAKIDGVLVAKMMGGGVETILGTYRDPVFGQMVMFGLGGILTEVLGDVAFKPAPFGKKEAMEMIKSIKGYAVLAGARGKAAADVDTLAAALSDLSIFAAANADTLESVDVNPFVVREKGGAALDALILRQTD